MPTQMNLVIEPMPSEPEREAIVRALAAAAAGPRESGWWRRGVEEATGAEPEEPF